MTTKNELLELASAQQGDTVTELALKRYNQASAEMVQYAKQLTSAADFASMRVFHPEMTPTLDTTQYIIIASKLATAERMAWEALVDIACALEAAGVEVEW